METTDTVYLKKSGKEELASGSQTSNSLQMCCSTLKSSVSTFLFFDLFLQLRFDSLCLPLFVEEVRRKK